MTEHPSGFFEATEMPTTGWWEALWPDPARVLDAVGITNGIDVVDLCSGDGWFTLAIAQRARSVIAIDIDKQLLDVSRARLMENGLTNCTFVTGDAYDIRQHVSQSVNFVFLANAFHGVPDRLRLACAVHDVLKSRGHFAVVNWYPRDREKSKVLGEPRGPPTELRMSPDITIKAIEPSGFTALQVVDVPPYHYGAVFERCDS